MSLIKSEISKTYLLEEDAVEGFSIAVQNGQTRLALQILSEIIPVFEEIFLAILEDDNEEQGLNEEKAIEQKVVEEKAVEQVVEEKVEEAKPTSAKKTNSKSEENKVVSE